LINLWNNWENIDFVYIFFIYFFTFIFIVLKIGWINFSVSQLVETISFFLSSILHLLDILYLYGWIKICHCISNLSWSIVALMIHYENNYFNWNLVSLYILCLLKINYNLREFISKLIKKLFRFFHQVCEFGLPSSPGDIWYLSLASIGFLVLNAVHGRSKEVLIQRRIRFAARDVLFGAEGRWAA